MTFDRLQNEASEWSLRNFGPHYGTGYRNLLGIMKEVGELAHAHLKAEQGIRTSEDHAAAKIDAVADIMIFLVNYCDSQNINLNDAIEATWAKVKARRAPTARRAMRPCCCGSRTSRKETDDANHDKRNSACDTGGIQGGAR